MRRYQIVKDDMPSLREVSKEIPAPYAPEIKDLLREMVQYLKDSQDPRQKKKGGVREGIGLACPQIGKNIRAFAVYYPISEEDGSTRIVQYGLIDPKIISESVKLCALRDGERCLSVDEDHEGYVYRPHKIILKAYDVLTEKDVIITARGFDAIVLQHEYDHLNGVLYYDHIDQKAPFRRREGSYLV